MAITRASIIQGPAIIQVGAVTPITFYTREPFVLDVSQDTFEILTDAYGKADERVIARKVSVSFVPAGEIKGHSGETTVINALWGSIKTLARGASLLCATDQPLVIWTLDGKKYTIPAVALTGIPSLDLTSRRNPIGTITYTGYCKDNTDWTEATNPLVKLAAVSFVDPGNFDSSGIPMDKYTGVWGTVTGFTSFKSEAGFKVDFGMKTFEVDTDSDGPVDIRFDQLDVTVKCAPIGPTEQNVLDALRIMGSGARPGRSLHYDLAGSATPDLVITGGTTPMQLVFTLKAAALKSAPFNFAADKKRLGEVEFVATRTVSGGAVSALFDIALS